MKANPYLFKITACLRTDGEQSCSGYFTYLVLLDIRGKIRSRALTIQFEGEVCQIGFSPIPEFLSRKNYCKLTLKWVLLLLSI